MIANEAVRDAIRNDQKVGYKSCKRGQLAKSRHEHFLGESELGNCRNSWTEQLRSEGMHIENTFERPI